MIVYLPLFICLIGLLLFFICANKPEWQDVKAIAKDMFWTGLLITLYEFANKVLTLGK
jgi:hypothetical protein